MTDEKRSEEGEAVSDCAVWIDPGRKSGEPCVAGHRIPVEMVVNAVRETGVDNAMGLWCLTRQEVLGACWYAAMGFTVRLHDNSGEYAPEPWRHRNEWGAWARRVHGAMWSGEYDNVPDPAAPSVTGTRPGSTW